MQQEEIYMIYLQKNFADITWKDKMNFLYQISDGYLF